MQCGRKPLNCLAECLCSQPLFVNPAVLTCRAHSSSATPTPACSWRSVRVPSCPQSLSCLQSHWVGQNSESASLRRHDGSDPDSARVDYRSGVPVRILRTHGRSVTRLDSPPVRTRGSQPPCTISQPRRPAWPAPAARASSGAARGVCCLPSGTPNTHASHSVPFSPTRPTRTSAWSTNPRAARPNGSPAAQLQPPADAPSRWACPGTAEQARHGPGRCPGAASPPQRRPAPGLLRDGDRRRSRAGRAPMRPRLPE